MSSLAPFMGVVSIVAVVGWIIRSFIVSRQRIQVARLQAELQTRLLDKFGTSQEMLAYLQSSAGERFLDSATIERPKPYGRILGSLQSGVILFLVGLALLYLAGSIPDADEAFTFLGTLGLALGAGFLASAFLAYRLSRSWGLIGGRPESPGSES